MSQIIRGKMSVNKQLFDFELYPEFAPITVENFVQLANSKFYDGLTFHRIIPNFMIQGGDPKGSGSGGPGWTIKGEFSANGWQNPLQHGKGVMSMARTDRPDSAGSQFFICVSDELDFLDGQYATFGKVITNYSAIEVFSEQPRDKKDRPLQPIRIDYITINK
jgi:peptidyl-prolyl cis-trans isomerase B (cyclophilin B)